MKPDLFCINQLNLLNAKIQKNVSLNNKGPLWPWSYGSWIYNYLCNQCIYHHWCCEFKSRSRWGVQNYV